MAVNKRAGSAKTQRPKQAKQPKPGCNALGTFLFHERIQDVMTQPELAEMLGISKSHLNDIEKGRKVVSVERAVRFAKSLGVPEVRLVKLALQDLLTNAGLDLVVELRTE